jgi:hypothetical protein
VLPLADSTNVQDWNHAEDLYRELDFPLHVPRDLFGRFNQHVAKPGLLAA